MEETSHKKQHTIWFHFYDILEKAELPWPEVDQWFPGGKDQLQNGSRESREPFVDDRSFLKLDWGGRGGRCMTVYTHTCDLSKFAKLYT